MINSTEIKRQLPDDELIAFGYMPPKSSEQNKVYSPGDPITKEMIADYYHKMAEYIVPYLSNRPVNVKRSLTFDEALYLKEGDPDIPVLLNRIKGTTREKGMDTIACNNLNAFLFLVKKGLTEINLWHSQVDLIDYPDYLVIDLDPSEQNTFAQVKRVARVLKSVLDKAGAESFCKTSGATGIHIFIPVGVRYPYPIIRDFAFTICMLTNKRIPELTCMDKKKAYKEHKIHLDYLQNKKGQTISAVYGVRDLPGAPVSTPIAWEELKDDLNPFDFNIFTVPERIKKTGDLYTGLLNNGINIQKCIQSLGSV